MQAVERLAIELEARDAGNPGARAMSLGVYFSAPQKAGAARREAPRNSPLPDDR